MPDAAEAVARGFGVQLERLRAAIARGVPRLGWKLALTDPAAQRRLGLSEPSVGVLDGERALGSGDLLRLEAGSIPKVEAELAIRVGRDVAGSESPGSARSAIAALAPAIELVDYSKPSETLEAIVGHAAFHSAAVFGDEREPGDLPGLGSDWPRLFKNDQLARACAPELAAESLESLVALVARTLERHGERLREGDRILSGSFTRPLGVQPGDAIRAECGPLGGVELRLD